MNKFGITILYLSVGSGHQVAAKAIKEALLQERVKSKITVEDLFANKLRILPSVLNAFQSVSIVLTPDLYDIAWRRGVFYDTYEWITDISLLQDYIYEKIKEHNAEIIIATHVLPCALAVGIRRRLKSVKKIYGVITDFGVHKFWPLRGIDGYFVGHEEIKNTLSFYGVERNHIYVTGIPIKPAFESISQPNIAKANELNALLTVGGIQSSAYVGVRRFLFEFLTEFRNEAFDNVRLTLITGNQAKLKKEIQEWLNEHKVFNIQLLGLVRDMEILMSHHQMLITKPGGLILAEALASGLSLIVYKPGPGQESANVEFLARHNLAFYGEEPTEIINILKRCSTDPQLVFDMQTRAKKVGRPNSARKIASIISKEINARS